MNRLINLLLVALPFIVASCEKSGDIGFEEIVINTIVAEAHSDTEDTKTVLADESTLKVNWLSGDAINVFFGTSASSKFTTTNSGPIAQFSGSISVITGGGDGLTDDTALWGVYPYNSANTTDGTSVTLTLPSTQTGKAGSFADDLFLTVAKSKNFYMSFYNLCASVYFQVSASDIKAVTFSGNNGEALAGKVQVGFESYPYVKSYLTEKTVVSITPQEGDYFVPGNNYYLVVLPAHFTKGMTMTYYKEETKASYSVNVNYDLKRSVFINFINRDAGLTFTQYDSSGLNIGIDGWENVGVDQGGDAN